MLLLLFVVLSGCTEQRGKTPMTIDYHKGTEGVRFNFVGHVPLSLYENEIFHLVLRMENKGAFDIDAREYTLYGLVTYSFDPLYFEDVTREEENFQGVLDMESLQSQLLSIIGLYGETILNGFQLAGRSIDFPDGQTEIYTYEFKAKPVLGQREEVDSNIFFQFCYPYQTTFSTKICMDFDKEDRDARSTVCQGREEYSFGGGQGGPIAVTKVKPHIRVTPQYNTENIVEGYTIEPEFVIEIENKGDGTPRKFNFVSDHGMISRLCHDSLTEADDWNAVWIDGAKIADVDLDCSPSLEQPPVYRLRDNKARFTCKIPEGVENTLQYVSSNYYTQLHLDLWYLYSEGLTKKVTIKKFA